ncbi:DUF4832 domain-containing protein [candidate division KSB1 bacterium]
MPIKTGKRKRVIKGVFLTLAVLHPTVTPLLGQETNRSPGDSVVIIKPEEYPHPLRNPHKGFTNRRQTRPNEWATLTHSYVPWNEIERDSTDGIERIRLWSQKNWAGVEKQNIKVIPRVYLHWSGNRTYWPDDMTTGDYSSPQFVKRVQNLIRKIGRCWDTDPRVAHIEMGIIGKWGEHHSPSPTDRMQQILGTAFRKAFKNKKVMVRHPWEFDAFEFGIYWDSWAHENQMNSHGQGIADLGTRWRTEIIGGEAAYDWGSNKIQPGDNPTDTMVDPAHRDFFIDTIRSLHCTQLRWVADYDPHNPTARDGAEEVQKVFGYRYVIDQVSYPSRIEPGEEFSVSIKLRNTGSAPFYYDWPMELALLDEDNKIAWRADFQRVDIRTWMPGDNWNGDEKRWEIAPTLYRVHETFQLDNNLPAGTFKLALAVLDPSGRLPSLRFAVKNYLSGGRHPIGYIGVGADIRTPKIDPASFDDPYTDKSLRYLFNPAMVDPVK